MNTKSERNPSKVIALVIVIMFILVLFVAPASAAVKGNLTFVHGVNTSQKYTYGKTTSTQTENSMCIDGHIYYLSGPNSGSYAYYQGTGITNTKSLTKTIYPGSVIGRSLFEYYVDGVSQHISTSWWDFDFT